MNHKTKRAIEMWDGGHTIPQISKACQMSKDNLRKTISKFCGGKDYERKARTEMRIGSELLLDAMNKARGIE